MHTRMARLLKALTMLTPIIINLLKGDPLYGLSPGVTVYKLHQERDLVLFSTTPCSRVRHTTVTQSQHLGLPEASNLCHPGISTMRQN